MTYLALPDWFNLQKAVRKPVTINWRDMNATINEKALSAEKEDQTDDQAVSEEAEMTELDTPADPVVDPLSQLDDGLPDLSGYGKHDFDLALQFDIQRYIDVLADSVTTSASATQEGMIAKKGELHSRLKETAANALAPADDEWEW